MKKTLYYSAVSICWLIFLMHLFGPFGGPISILDYLRDGFYSEKYLQKELLIEITKPVQLINQFIAILFWCSIFLCMISIFFKKIEIKSKQNIALVSILIILMIVFIPKIYKIFL